MGNSPTNYVDPSGMMPPDVTFWHHLFPQEFESELIAKGMGDFVHSAENGWYLLGEDHQQMHEYSLRSGEMRSWNNDWKVWLEENRHLSRNRFREALKDKLAEMKRAYGLVDKKGNVLRGSSVAANDKMPYKEWERMAGEEKAAEKAKWRQQRDVEAWKPSDIERRRNELEYAARRKRIDAEMKLKPKVGTTLNAIGGGGALLGLFADVEEEKRQREGKAGGRYGNPTNHADVLYERYTAKEIHIMLGDRGPFYFNKYYKAYLDPKTGKKGGWIEIEKEEYEYYVRQNDRLYGYWDRRGRFVPGVLRDQPLDRRPLQDRVRPPGLPTVPCI